MKSKYLYRMVQIRYGKRTIKFHTTDLRRGLRFLSWYAKTYKEGLLLEILPLKKIYDTKQRVVKYVFE